MDVHHDLAAPLQLALQDGQLSPVRRPQPSAALVTMVSQKMLAVSARAIGVSRCSGVRVASCTLW